MKRLKGILDGLKLVQKYFNMPIIYPIHPRAKKRMQEFKLNADGFIIIDPVDYLSFLKLESNAKLVFTDSGGVQEEACILKVPCVTLRYNTERPETIDIGANIIAGTEPENILEKTKIMINKDNNWDNPFGDGKAGEKIVKIINEIYK